MTIQEKAKELILLFEPHVYPYLGSGMLTNTYDDDVILMMSKKCAIKCIEEINKIAISEGTRSFFDNVKTEIEKMEKLPEYE